MRRARPEARTTATRTGSAGSPMAKQDPQAREKVPEATSRSRLKRLLPLLALLAGLVAFFALGLDDYVRFEALRDNRAWLLDQVARHAALAALAFMAEIGRASCRERVCQYV